MATANQIILGGKMLETRNAARRLYGDQYDSRIVEAAHLINRCIIAEEIDAPIKFLPWLSKKMASDRQEIGVGEVLLFTAATVEMIENPSRYERLV